MKFKSILLVAVALSGSFAITGCGGPTERELQCMELTGDRLCRNEYEQQADAERRGMPSHRRNDYGPVGAGEYHNYYGNEQYGRWDNDRFTFNDQYGAQASQTNAFLLGAGLGGLGAYALTRNAYKKSNPNGWTDQTRKVDKPLGNDGKPISQKEFAKRKAQSDKDIAKNKAKYQQSKAKTIEKQKQKQARTNAAKSKIKPSATQTNDLKAKLKAKQAARKADKASGKSSIGSKLRSNERKSLPRPQKKKRAQKSTYKQQKSSSRTRNTSSRSSSKHR